MVVDNDGNFTLGSVQGYNQVVDGTTDQATINIETTSDGTATIGNLATAGGSITVNANNGVSGTAAAATIGAVTSQNGQVDITAGQNVDTLGIGAIDAGSGAVNITASNRGATTIDNITTTGTATVDASASGDATTLSAGNIGVLDYDGNEKADTIGDWAAGGASLNSAVTIGGGSVIETGAGNDIIGVNAYGAGEFTIDPGLSTGGGDIISVSVANEASETSHVNINLSAGKDGVSLGGVTVAGKALVSVSGFNNAGDGDLISIDNTVSQASTSDFRGDVGNAGSAAQPKFVADVFAQFGITVSDSATITATGSSSGKAGDNGIFVSNSGADVDGFYVLSGTVGGTTDAPVVDEGSTLIQILGVTATTGITFAA